MFFHKFSLATLILLTSCILTTPDLVKNIHMYRANSTFGQRSLKYKAGNLWNELPLEVKEQRYSSVGRLKLILTSYLLNQTTTLEVH